MKKWGNRFIIWSIILFVGPFFGFTLKGFGEIDYSGHIIGGIFFLIIGYIMKNITIQKPIKFENKNHEIKNYNMQYTSEKNYENIKESINKKGGIFNGIL